MSVDLGMDKQIVTCPYLTTRKKRLLTHAAMRMNLSIIVLTERRQTLKRLRNGFLTLCDIPEKQNHRDTNLISGCQALQIE